MKTEPSVLLVGGSDEYQRRRLVSKIVSARRKDGWAVTPVSGEDPETIEATFSMSMMFEASTLLVVEKPEKLDPEIVSGQIQSPDPKVVLLLVSDAEKPSGPVFDPIPKTNTKLFSLPPFYKMEEYAANFAVSEAKSLGNPLEMSLALSLVKKVGTDLGVISFELRKASLLAGPGVQITAAILRDTLAPLSETDGTAVLEALGWKEAKRLAVELAKYQASRGGDPTIELCGRVLTPALTRWLSAAHLAESKLPPAAAAGIVGANPWYWEHKILPFATRWGVVGCAKLIRVVARSQALVFQGAISPFSFLESSLMAVLQG